MNVVPSHPATLVKTRVTFPRVLMANRIPRYCFAAASRGSRGESAKQRSNSEAGFGEMRVSEMSVKKWDVKLNLSNRGYW